ncbi:uncharacterized protein LOC128221995 [Mya arenaria]|uniref:uncharacterized protein LOC128221995 n=1 Tax=Mya arenaria TaxID=6604 RepID=UPI0022E1CE86|nr:uncharacterized protein LOC128221995 [Mya arenaria]
MKMGLNKSIICLIVLLGFSSRARAISCYSCNSITDGAKCADPFGDGKVETGCTACSKFDGLLKGLQVVFRSCETDGYSIGCSYTTIRTATGDLCGCTTELCNASSRVSMATVMLILLPLSVVLFLKISEM